MQEGHTSLMFAVTDFCQSSLKQSLVQQTIYVGRKQISCLPNPPKPSYFISDRFVPAQCISGKIRTTLFLLFLGDVTKGKMTKTASVMFFCQIVNFNSFLILQYGGFAKYMFYCGLFSTIVGPRFFICIIGCVMLYWS